MANVSAGFSLDIPFFICFADVAHSYYVQPNITSHIVTGLPPFEELEYIVSTVLGLLSRFVIRLQVSGIRIAIM